MPEPHAASPKTLQLLAGRYGDSAGLVPLSIDGDGRCTVGQAVPGTRNVSYAAWSARHRKLYAVREEDDGAIDVLAAEDGWQVEATVPTAGAKPCHCALDATERYLAVANYESGSASVFALDAGGIPQPAPWRFAGEGSGPVAGRQDGPHAHWAGFVPAQDTLLVADLGADLVRAFAFGADRGVHGADSVAMAAPPGSGPRWLRFGLASADALLVSELDSTLSLCTWIDRKLYEWDRCSTRAPGARGPNLAGHVAVNAAGDRVFVTNRGDDAVALFAIDRGHLRFVASVASGGESPRFLCLLEAFGLLLVGHETAGPIAVLAVADDRLRRVGQCGIDSVAWIGRVPGQPG